MFFCAVMIQDDGLRFQNDFIALKSEARRQFVSVAHLIDKLLPVAAALGLNNPRPEFIQTDYYDLLGVSPDAATDEIKKAYRQHARITHPDIQKGTNQKFIIISEAYAVLSDETLRRQYDISRKATNRLNWSENTKHRKDKTHQSRVLRRYSVWFVSTVLLLAFFALLIDQINRELSLTGAYFDDLPKKEPSYPITTREAENNEYSPAAPPMPLAPINPINRINENFSEPQPTESRPPEIEKKEFAIHPEKRTPLEKKKIDSADQTLPQTETPENTQLANRQVLKDHLTKKKGGGVTLSGIRATEPVDGTRLRSQTDTINPEIMAADISSTTILHRINAFLEHYARTYEKGNVESFMKLFGDHATENGRTIKSLFPVYQRNFASIESIRYSIKMRNYSWDLARGKITVNGEFSLHWRKKGDAHPYHSDGVIKLCLIPGPNPSFLVESLSYSFNKNSHR